MERLHLVRFYMSILKQPLSITCLYITGDVSLTWQPVVSRLA